MMKAGSAQPYTDRQARGDPISAESLAQLAQQKELEWKQVQQLRTQALETALKEKQQQLVEERNKFVKLKEDFKYNYKLLNDRHAELDTYDSKLSELKMLLSKKESEISDLQIRLSDYETARTRESSAREELQRHYQQRIREKQQQMDQHLVEKDGELQQEREEIERVKRSLERQLREVEEEMDTQRRELTAGFEDGMRKREHEFRLQMDELNSKAVSHELKVKVLTKELDMVKASQRESVSETEKVLTGQAELENRLKQAQWQLQDVTAIKDARITELEEKIIQSEKAMRRMAEDFKRKHAELDQYLRDKETAIGKLRATHQDKQHDLEDKINNLQGQLEGAHNEAMQYEWRLKDLAKEKDTVIEKLQEELADGQRRWASQMVQVSQDSNVRDMDLQKLRESEEQLRVELQQKKLDIDRYKKDMQIALGRQSELEQSKAQVELDYQRKMEDNERKQYDKAEDLIRSLTKAKEEAQADLKMKEKELSHQTEFSQAMKADRDRALATLKQHGLHINHKVDISTLENAPETAVEKIAELENQNENLREVIRQMREEMETLGSSVPSSKPQNGEEFSMTSEYVKNLEKELQKYKRKFRDIEHEKMTGGAPASEASHKSSKSEQEMALAAAGDNTIIRTHIQALNNEIGSLRREKVEFAGQLRKQQTEIQHLHTQMNQLQKEPLEQQAHLSQLEYELGAQERRYKTEVSGLGRQVSELKLQLEQAHREADEYYKASMQRNMETTALGNQLSTLKLDLAQKRQPLNFGAQELLIQQLQDEIERLRQQVKGIPTIDTSLLSQHVAEGGGASTAVVSQLQTKLRLAAGHIHKLTKEKQQLIEVGNRLRSQLQSNGITVSSHPPGPKPNPWTSTRPSTKPADMDSKLSNKLQQLEQLQYQLSKQEMVSQRSPTPGGLSSGMTANTTSQVSSLPHTGWGMSSSSSSSTEPYTSGERTDEQQWMESSKSILKSTNSDYPVKLSPVPEDSRARPSTAPEMSLPHGPVPSDTLPTRPSTALSDLGTQRSSGGQGQVMMSMSSYGGESLQEIWKMLDEEGASPRPFTPAEMMHSIDEKFDLLRQSIEDGRPISAQSWTLHGKQPQSTEESKPQGRLAGKKLSQKALGKPGKKAHTKKQIRNYNVKDVAEHG